MLHREYHTCDKCGKVIHMNGGILAHSNGFEIEIPSNYVREHMYAREKAIKRAEELSKDDGGNVKVYFDYSLIRSETKYELCKHCAKELKKVVEQYMGKDGSNTNEW